MTAFPRRAGLAAACCLGLCMACDGGSSTPDDVDAPDGLYPSDHFPVWADLARVP
jgi:hypothetical protein